MGTTIKPTTKPGNSTEYCSKYCSNSNSTKPTTNSTTTTPTTKPGNSTGNSTKPTTKPTPIMPTTNSEFVHTEKGVTCSDRGFIDLSHQQECAAAVSHAKSFNSKAFFMSRTDNLDLHKGCWIHDSGHVWFNAHVTGSRSSFVTSLCKKGCLNSDGLTGFYHTHAGYWTVGGIKKGIKTRMECANNCTQNCVAFNTHALNTSSKGECYHYSNRSGLITVNERLSERSKAYIKCLVEGNSTGNSTKPTTTTTTIIPTTKPGNSTKYCCKYCSNSNSTKPTTKLTPITPTTKPGNNSGNSTKPTKKPTTTIPTTKPGNSTGNSTKPPTKPTTGKPTTNSTSKYFLGIKGSTQHGCQNATTHQQGKDILNKDVCKAACTALGIDIDIGRLKDDMVCYVGGNKKCRQTGTPGTGATLVCNKNG